jgi:Survival motor neuron (SMN) interacting protein 1 (SIP1).
MSLQQQCLPVPPISRKRRRCPPDSGSSIETSPSSHGCPPPPPPPHTNDETRRDPFAPVEIVSLESMDAMEYLAFVRHQAMELPDIFVSKISLENSVQSNDSKSSTSAAQPPIDGSAAARDYLCSNRLDIIPPPSSFHVPPIRILNNWAEQTLSNFSSLRTYLQACRGEFKKCLRLEDKLPVPPSKDLYAWHIFCLGDEIRNDMEHKMIHVQIMNNGLNDGDENLSAAEVDVLLSPYSIPQGGHEPTTRLMCQFDQIIIRKLISHHTRYVAAGCIVTVKRMQWIYAILARLDKPLHRDEASVLMELLRELCRVRSKIIIVEEEDVYEEKDDESILQLDLKNQGGNKENKLDIIKAINVVVLLIGVYFEQYNHLEELLAYHHSQSQK